MPVERRGQAIRVMVNLANWQQEEPTGCGGGRQLSMEGTSRVTGDSHARFCERLGVKFPGPTRRRSAMVVPTANAFVCQAGHPRDFLTASDGRGSASAGALQQAARKRQTTKGDRRPHYCLAGSRRESVVKRWHERKLTSFRTSVRLPMRTSIVNESGRVYTWPPTGTSPYSSDRLIWRMRKASGSALVSCVMRRTTPVSWSRKTVPRNAPNKEVRAYW